MSGLTISGLRAGHGGAPVLDGLDLTVQDGTLACILGPSGCGKSTLLRVIAGFHRSGTGTVAVGGRVLNDDRTHVAAERRHIGYVPQDGALFPHLSAAANIGFGLPRADRRERVAELLDLVGLSGLGDRHPHQLSGGQQQRVALARALAPRPELLLLDEPFAALDAALRTEVRAQVAATLRAAGATAILVTHDVDEALSFADLIAVMRDGRIVQADSGHALYHRPADAQIARTLGEANLLPAVLRGGQADTALGAVPLADGLPDELADEAETPHGSQTVMLRPGQLRLAAEGMDTTPARILDSRFRGTDWRVELTLEDSAVAGPPLIAYVSTAPPPVGQQVHVGVQGSAYPIGTSADSADAIVRPPTMAVGNPVS
ncbi:ABC transporter ATP-binding protein [Catenulispora sp. NF23]|uniref:ABC transporter ATP-binding protein n=1 Tax=Catenulispora pinistramenti TaxID=2705254 RepID=UPI001BAC4B62|nr:ABC transporter ATP-binding protein [Catenulispora pinistramenti]MBS2532167.1 ABC transporter ATP-binding protein [Catenulispora pinistramenti]